VAALVQELRLARAALARSEALYRAAVTNFPRGAVLLFGADLRPLLTGGAGLPSIQPRSSAVLGTAPAAVFPPEMAQELTPCFRSALAGESSSVDVRREDRTYRAEVVPVSGAGSAVGLAVIQDVTDERRAALLAAVERARTAFDDVRLHPTAPPDDPVAHTLEVAVRLAEALAPEFGEPPSPAGDDLARVRWLLERLLAPGPEDDELLALLGWFATTHDLRKALEALMKRYQPPE
jgi:hypothetical protein